MADRAASVVFDRIADDYDETRGGASRAQAVAVPLAERLPRGRPILEVGVGTAIVARAVSDRGFEVVGVDLSMPMLHKARERLGARVANADALRLPIASGSIPAAYAVWVLHLVADVKTALAEIARVLEPGGTLLVIPSTPLDSGADVTELSRSLIDHLRVQLDPPQRLAELGAQNRLDLVGNEVVAGEPYAVTPNGIADRIERRVFSALWDVDDQTWETTVVPAIAALRALPDPDRPRRIRNAYPLLTFRRV
jgi:SAM-dependent methyltransferase